MKAYEPIEQCVSRYVRSCPVAGLIWRGNVGDEHIRFIQTSLRAPQSDVGFYYQGEKTALEIDLEVLTPHPDLILGFSILNSHNQPIARSRLCDHPCQAILEASGHHKLSFELNLDLFHPGEYQVRVECSLLNKKRILDEDIRLKFAVCSPHKQLKYEMGAEKEGIRLGSGWSADS